MRPMAIIKITCVVITALALMTITISCDDKKDYGRHDAEAFYGEMSLTENPLSEKYEMEFRRVIDGTNDVFSVNKAVYGILEDVLKLPADDVPPVLDRFFDIANSASLESITDYPAEHQSARIVQIQREQWFMKMFGIVHQVFLLSMNVKKDPYDNWDKIFAFFENGTNELAMVERCRIVFNRDDAADRRRSRFHMTGYNPELYPNAEKNKYLRSFGGNLLKWIHIVRDMDIKHHDRQPTDEQKSRIFLRFDEFEKFIRPFTERGSP